MVTALDQPSDRVRGLEAGADYFLSKPVTDVALISLERTRNVPILAIAAADNNARLVRGLESG